MSKIIWKIPYFEKYSLNALQKNLGNRGTTWCWVKYTKGNESDDVSLLSPDDKTNKPLSYYS